MLLKHPVWVVGKHLYKLVKVDIFLKIEDWFIIVGDPTFSSVKNYINVVSY